MQNDQNSMEKVWKKYGIYLDQKGKNPDYFPGKYEIAINMQWSALKGKQWMFTEFTAYSKGFFSDEKYFFLQCQSEYMAMSIIKLANQITANMCF